MPNSIARQIDQRSDRSSGWMLKRSLACSKARISMYSASPPLGLSVSDRSCSRPSRIGWLAINRSARCSAVRPNAGNDSRASPGPSSPSAGFPGMIEDEEGSVGASGAGAGAGVGAGCWLAGPVHWKPPSGTHAQLKAGVSWNGAPQSLMKLSLAIWESL